MHILHIVQLYYPVASGAARYFAEIGERLVSEGHQVTVLATDAYDLEHFWSAGRRRIEQRHELHKGVSIVRLPVKRIVGPAITYPIIRRLMVELSRLPGTTPLLRHMAQITPRLPDLLGFLQQSPRYDLIHGTNITLDFAILPALKFAQQQQIPFVTTPFVHLGEPQNDAIRRYYLMRHQVELLKQSKRVVTMTGLETQALIDRGVDPQRIRRVGVGVELSEVLGGEAERFRTEQQINGQLVLYIGAMAFDKGAIHTIEAMQRLWAAGSDATLAMIGAPLEHFTQFYDRLPAETKARIRLLPYAPETVKRDALAAADVFMMPSRTDSFGIAYLEAWCYRCPVIGARAGGVPDLVSDGVDGILPDFGDVAAIAAAVERLLHDRELAQTMGQAGYDKVMREYTWDEVYQRARSVYAEVLPALA